MSTTSIHNSQGIQILLEAEKEAKKIIADGREYRNRRLKEAKTEALQEILALKEAKKQQVLETERKYAEMLQATIEKEEHLTANLIAETTRSFEEKRESVISMLLGAVAEVTDPKPHINWTSKQ